ncbi:MAG: response regulator [Elusimicrobiaceae bacterium]|nr:response regulator [Elusimicrobiaceae bacterium]
MEIAKKEIPNLILLDLMLPKVSGFEICKQLKQHEKTFKIPVVIISTLNKEEDIALAKQMGADKYIGKPYNLSEILEEVKYLLCS